MFLTIELPNERVRKFKRNNIITSPEVVGNSNESSGSDNETAEVSEG